MKRISAIIINYNTPELTERALAALLEHADAEIGEVILIDNASEKKIVAENITDRRVRKIFNQENIGFARAVNQGLRLVSGEFVLLLNSDVIVSNDAIGKLLAHLETHQQVGIIGPRMVYPDGEFQVSCGFNFTVLSEFIRLTTLYKYLPGGSLASQNRFNRALLNHGGEVGWVSGGCMLIRREVIDKIGRLDDHFFFGIEDVDFCHRAKDAGWQVSYLPSAEVVHYHGHSSGGRRTIGKVRWEKDNLEYFLKKHWPERKLRTRLIIMMHAVKITLLERYSG